MQPVVEHFTALRNSEFEGEVLVGLVGSERSLALRIVRGFFPEARVAVEADEGYEMVTLDRLHHAAGQLDPETPVLYAHTKGSFRPTLLQSEWRRCMTRHCVEGWRQCVGLLESYDLVGAHWMDTLHGGSFAGNFWWARAGYAAALPAVTWDDRWRAEGWVGQNSPRVWNLDPGPLESHDSPVG